MYKRQPIFILESFSFLLPRGSIAPNMDSINVFFTGCFSSFLSEMCIRDRYGDGFSNIFYPVSGYFMATLALGHVPYEKWMKKMLPLFGMWTVAAAVFMIIAQAIQWGPF